MGDAIKLVGIVIVIIGFALKFDTLATVVVAGIVTGLVGGMSIMDILSTLGAAFLTNRTATLFILTLPVIGICERMGLRDKAVDFIRGIKSATTGRLLSIWQVIRTIASAFSLRIGGHPQFIRPLINPMAQACAIADQARTIRIPVHMVETINKLTRIQRQLIQELGREPSAEEIAEKMDGMTPEKVREIQKISLEPVSLETPIGEEDDSHLGDFIEDEGAMSPDDYAANELLKDELNDVLLELTDREEKVLRLRFGLDDGRTRTLEEVGREFNVTRERIRQIEAKALRKLKHPSRSKRLKDFLDR